MAKDITRAEPEAAAVVGIDGDVDPTVWGIIRLTEGMSGRELFERLDSPDRQWTVYPSDAPH
jgi:hypothetical protein